MAFASEIPVERSLEFRLIREKRVGWEALSLQGQVRNYGQTQGLALGQGLGLDMTIGWKRVRSPSLGLGVSLPPM